MSGLVLMVKSQTQVQALTLDVVCTGHWLGASLHV